MPRDYNIKIGDTFGFYTVVAERVHVKGQPKKFECACKCGVLRHVTASNLITGNSKSCGCRQKTPMSNSPEHLTWRGMVARCTNPRSTGYHRYGGAGVSVCARWMNFNHFYEDMGPRGEGMTLDRIDGSKGYSPDNCKWSTRREQGNNRKNNIRLKHQGAEMTVAEWARHLGIKHVTLKNRIRLGWSVSDALERPVLRQITRDMDYIKEVVDTCMGVRDFVGKTGFSKSTYYNALKALQKLVKKS